MKKVTVTLYDYCTEEHNNAVLTLVQNLNGLKLIGEKLPTAEDIMEQGEVTIECEAEDYIIPVLEDMNICDYMTVA